MAAKKLALLVLRRRPDECWRRDNHQRYGGRRESEVMRFLFSDECGTGHPASGPLRACSGLAHRLRLFAAADAPPDSTLRFCELSSLCTNEMEVTMRLRGWSAASLCASAWMLLFCAAVGASSSPSLEVVYAFTGAGGLPVGSLARAADGTVYGVTQYGGVFDGSIYALVPDGSGGVLYEELHAFQGPDGAQPVAGLILGTDGKLYGTTGFGGGSNGQGSVFGMDPERTADNPARLHWPRRQ